MASLALPSTTTLARHAGSSLPRYITRDQARAIIQAAETTSQRLFLETLWQSGGRLSEVLRLRPCDVQREDGALRIANLKQRSATRAEKLVYVSPDLTAALLAYVRDRRLKPNDWIWTAPRDPAQPMCRVTAWRLVTSCASRADVYLPNGGDMTAANARDFRHGAAVHQLRSGVPLSEIQEQLGHARIDTTTIYTRLTSEERRRMADRVSW